MINDIVKAIKHTEDKITKICMNTLFYEGDVVKRMEKICNLLAKKGEMIVYGVYLDTLIGQEKPKHREVIREYLNHEKWEEIATKYKVSRKTVFRVYANFKEKHEKIIKKIQKLCENSCVFKNYRV